MRVGVVVDSISRNAGGLFLSVRSLSKELQKLGLDVEVFALRDAWSDLDLEAWAPLTPHLYEPLGPRRVGYSPDLRPGLAAAQLDLLHLHGIWQFSSVATSWWGKGRPTIVSPRGMLDDWALANSAFVKRLAWLMFERSNMSNASCLHALCEEEYQAFRALGLDNPIAVVPNGVKIESTLSVSKKNQRSTMLFLGRLHPKKGLDELLEGWSLCGAPNSNWKLKIAGHGDSKYEAHLMNLTESFGLGKSVEFLGPVYGEQKALELRQADAFVLPSFSEGLPMAVLEAWSYSLPVLMTDECNLKVGFSNDAAVRISNEPHELGEQLQRFFDLDWQRREKIGANGYKLARDQFSWDGLARQMNAVYQWLLGKSEKPECVRLD